jgi:glycosyltransferase involved in cell wall biosynthesis
MKILIINWQDIKNPFGGGAEVHLHEIFKRIAGMGHYVELFCCEIDGEPNEEIIDGINIFRKGKRNTFNFGVKKIYKEKYSNSDFDIVIDDINKIPFYTPLYIKKPLLAISHHFFGTSIFKEANLIAGTYVYLSEKILDFVYKKTPFVVVSESTLSEFSNRGFDKKNFSIVFNAIEPTEYPMSICEKNQDFTITYFGRLKKYKSVDHLFYAFAKVKINNPSAKLVIIGRGDFKEYLEKLGKQLGISDSLTFYGFVSKDEKSKLLSQSHIVVNTSVKEGWGITNIEANACGTPVISANVPGLRDSVKNGVSGLLYEYGNIEELSNSIEKVINDKVLLNTLENGALEWAKSFSWDKSAKAMLTRIEEVIDNFNKK